MIVDKLLDFVFPRSFLWQGEIPFSVPIRLEGKKLHSMGFLSLDRLVAVSSYGNPKMRETIAAFKYRRVRSLGEPLSAMLLPALRMLSAPPQSVLCPVPLHWTRFFLRGFNQSDILARKVSEQSGFPVELLLRRVIPTGHQTRRCPSERLLAMRNVFRSIASCSASVILIDDVTTSGATIDACAYTLKKSGVRWVGAAVLALG